jgi:signal transduction histidine kinase
MGAVILPGRRLQIMALVGVVCALLVLAGGRLLERVVLGGNNADAVERAERDVRESFDAMSRRLREMGRALASPDALRAAQRGDTAAASALFDSAAAVIAGQDDGAVTVYGSDGIPLVWAGRPSELRQDRLQGGEAWFLAQGPLGVRLVYVRPVDAETAGLGVVAAERPVPLAGGATDTPPGLRDGTFQFPTRVGPVSVYLAFEGARLQQGATSFDVTGPSGGRLFSASLSDSDVAVTRERWRRVTRSISLLVLAAALALIAGPLLDWRNRARDQAAYAAALLSTLTIVVAARGLVRLASPADWSSASLFSGAAYASTLLRPFLTSAFDFLLTMLTAGAVVGMLLYAVEAWRVRRGRRRHSVAAPRQLGAFAAAQLAAGGLLAIVLLAHTALLKDTIANATIDLLHMSLRPLNGARIALQIGLIVAHATTVGLGAVVLRAALVPWRMRRGDIRLATITIACWAIPYLGWQLATNISLKDHVPALSGLAAIVIVAMSASRLIRRYRHGSQAFRLTLLTIGLIVPAFAFYPTVFQLAWQAKMELVQTGYAPEAINQRQSVQTQLRQSLDQIDRFPGLADLLTAGRAPNVESSTGAFQVWQTTALASYPITSSVELYGPDRSLVSRFAFNLPEDLATPQSEEQTCDWELYEGVAPFFAEERRVLHAGSLICSDEPGAPPLGSVVVRAILDYENLPFIFSSNPYVELMRPADSQRDRRLAGRDVEYAVYGWSRTPLYQSEGTAWPIPDEVFARVEQGREPFWAVLTRGDERFDVYLLNDRGGIYALGFPVVSTLGHLVNLAELTVLAVAAFLLLLTANGVFGLAAGRVTEAPALLRELRASFYRKLFIAFVAAVFLPVVALALVTRNYVADQMRASIAEEAVRTASSARRVVEDLVGPRAAQQGLGVDDNLMVWVSRLIDQDVNVFDGPRLLATSERNLFESGLLPTRTPAPAYLALALRREAATVTSERIGGSEHLVAAAPLTLDSTLLSVPLASRQREIDEEIDNLDRRVLLSVLLFMIAGAGLGYSMAERISDPVNRLTRATRRIARGELDTRISGTSSDELRRLVEDFNRMARELQAQRHELERTHRLEAWAEMARQVAHEIKNPLTPIQLNAEHLRRVHSDRGKPLGSILEECVDTILTQVTLLRRIASEFSSFASAPIARPTRVDVADLLREILNPYRAALADRIRFESDVPGDLPAVEVDRTLIARAVTNLVENALHAMPAAGTLRVVARADADDVRIRVSDTGSGMDAEALARAFEPYFSTKATGTGLGLPIAKRNVELNGGTINVSSERDTGTTVEVTLPVGRQQPV